MTSNPDQLPQLPTPDQVRDLDAGGAVALAASLNAATPTRALTEVEQLAALGTYVKVLGELEKELRAAVTASMGLRHDERVGAYLPDGLKMASVTRSDGNRSAKVADEAAALKWCLERYPEEITQTIRPAFLKMLLDASKGMPEGAPGVDPRSGEVLPFIEVRRGSPYVTITTTEEGQARMTTLANGFARTLEGAP